MKEKLIVFDIETTGLNPWFGDIVTCISAKIETNGELESWFTSSLNGKTEDVLIIEFFNYLKPKFVECKHIIVTKNGKAFDIPFLLARSVILECYQDWFTDIIEPMKHFDLHEITDKWVSLNDMAKLLNCVRKSGKGKEAIKLYEKKKFRKLENYCSQDVVVTYDVYKKYQKMKKEH